MHISDHSSRVETGQQYAVADRQGDWTAIWYLGQKGWFHNPKRHPTALWSAGLVATPKQGKASIPVYGRAYPEAAAYPANIPPQAVTPLQYSLPAGQKYSVGLVTRLGVLLGDHVRRVEPHGRARQDALRADPVRPPGHVRQRGGRRRPAVSAAPSSSRVVGTGNGGRPVPLIRYLPHGSGSVSRPSASPCGVRIEPVGLARADQLGELGAGQDAAVPVVLAVDRLEVAGQDHARRPARCPRREGWPGPRSRPRRALPWPHVTASNRYPAARGTPPRGGGGGR